jgi:hypothetical protein
MVDFSISVYKNHRQRHFTKIVLDSHIEQEVKDRRVARNTSVKAI